MEEERETQKRERDREFAALLAKQEQAMDKVCNGRGIAVNYTLLCVSVCLNRSHDTKHTPGLIASLSLAPPPSRHFLPRLLSARRLRRDDSRRPLSGPAARRSWRRPRQRSRCVSYLDGH